MPYVDGSTVGIGIVPAGIFPRSASVITTEMEPREVTSGNGAGAASDVYLSHRGG